MVVHLADKASASTTSPAISMLAISESRELWDKVQAQLDSNLRTHRNSAREQSSSLLTGLIEDGDGNRFTPSFTIKRGRRYRYYVSQVAIQNPASQQSGPTRLPAHDVESRITERLQAFLRSDAQVFDELSATPESPAVLHQLVAGAKKLAVRVTSLPADDLRDLLACILQRVIIQENNIRVMIRKSDLRELLEHGDQIIAASLVGLRKPMDPAELICLTIEAKRKRYGGEIHLVVPPSSCHNVLNGASFAEVGKHQVTVCRIFPHPQFMDGMAEHLGAGVAIPTLKSSIHVYEPTFLEGCD